MERYLKIVYVGAITAVFIFGIMGTYIIAHGGGFNVTNMSPLDAAYFTIVTMSTVGYGDILPITPLAKLFVMLLIVIGLSIFLSVVTVISGDFVNTRMERLSERISNAEKRRLRSHIVLIGTDGVNLAIAKELNGNSTKFIMIVSDKVMSDRLRGIGYRTFVADPTSEVDMSQFEIQYASKVIIDLKESSHMVYALLVVRALAKGVNVIVVAPSTEAERHLKELGVFKNETIISPNRLAADSIINKML